MIPSKHLVQGSAIERIILDTPAAEAVLAEAERAEAHRVVLIAARSLSQGTGEVEKIAQALGPRYAGLLPPIRPHAPKSDLVAVTRAALDANADLIVAVGGSSVMDGAKIVSLAHRHHAVSLEALDALRIRYDAQGQITSLPEDGPDIKVICIPTTLSGGEFNTLSGAYDETMQQKHGYHHPAMAPVAIILDPDIARHTPDPLWLATGMRAVDHAVETLVSPYSNPYYDGLAESGLRLLAKALPELRRNPGNREARLHSQIGAWQAIVPLVGGVPMGASHAIGHALGAFGISHGETSCVMAAAVQRWNAQRPCPAQRRVAEAFGEAGRPLDQILDVFVRGLGLPASLADIDIVEDQYARLAELTLADIWGGTNVRPLAGPEDVVAILRQATT